MLSLSESWIYEEAARGRRPEMRPLGALSVMVELVGYGSGIFAPKHGARIFRKAARLYEAAGGDPVR